MVILDDPSDCVDVKPPELSKSCYNLLALCV